MEHLLNSYDQDENACHLPFKKTKISSYQLNQNELSNEPNKISKAKYPTMSIKNLITSRPPPPSITIIPRTHITRIV